MDDEKDSSWGSETTLENLSQSKKS